MISGLSCTTDTTTVTTVEISPTVVTGLLHCACLSPVCVRQQWSPNSGHWSVLCSCTVPSIKPRVDGHYGGYMIDPQYERVPRDWDEHMLALEEADKAPSLTKAEEILAPFSMHSIHSALAEMPMFHLYAQVRTDSMHLFDCGGTMWHLVFLGNWIFSAHGADMLALANERLAAMPYHEDFTHFSRALWSKDDKSGAKRPVKMSVNWRCTEYAEMISQMIYGWSSAHCCRPDGGLR